MKIKKKIARRCAVLCLLVCCLAGLASVNVYAIEQKTVTFTAEYPEVSGEMDKVTLTATLSSESDIDYAILKTTKGYCVYGAIAWSKSPITCDSAIVHNDTYNYNTACFVAQGSMEIGGATWYYYGFDSEALFRSTEGAELYKTLEFFCIDEYMNGDHPDYNVLVDGFVTDEFSWTDPNNGGKNEPTYDPDIGSLILTDSTYVSMKEDNIVEGMIDAGDKTRDIKWKRKTSTGFNLTDNKYAQTYIQVWVESKVTASCSLYKEKHLDSYGEKEFLCTVDASALRCTVRLSDVRAALPKTHDEMIKLKAKDLVGLDFDEKYTFWFRVVCTDSILVIPGDTDAHYAGNWVAHTVTFTGDDPSGTTSYTVDENGNLVEEEDSPANQDNIVNESISDAEDIDDARDKVDSDGTKVSTTDDSFNLDDVEALFDFIGNIPSIIRQLFDFLPDWCLTIVAFSFVVTVLLIPYKLIRG